MTTVTHDLGLWSYVLVHAIRSVGVALSLTRKLGLEAIVKDYIASFKSIRNLVAFGIEGRRAHTAVFLINARFGL